MLVLMYHLELYPQVAAGALEVPFRFRYNLLLFPVRATERM
jgi:hypothetical protein